jgi:hypothetical protein
MGLTSLELRDSARMIEKVLTVRSIKMNRRKAGSKPIGGKREAIPAPARGTVYHGTRPKNPQGSGRHFRLTKGRSGIVRTHLLLDSLEVIELPS